ncbi:MAG TPA: class I SAM-dependent methyltransferase [bacterium]|nr:class I SAM-dependent methyltransferase [bacterium]
MDVSAWEAMAAWYDAKQGDEGDLWHRTLIDPALLRVVGPVQGQRLLDLACGNGYLARCFARMGARVTAVDASAAMIERARLRERESPLGIVYHVADTARLDALDDAGMDIAVCNMALMDIDDAAGTIGQVARVLRPGGRFVASLSHPCFDVVNASAWVIERIDFTTTVWRKVSRYRECFAGRVPWHDGADHVGHTPAYHRPLSWYVRALRAAEFVLTALEEPEPTGEFLAASSSGPWIAEIPLHCVIEARRDA